MGLRLSCLVAAAAFCSPVRAASAQDLAVGTYVRISYDCPRAPSTPQTLVSCRRAKGPLTAVTSDSLYLGGGSAGVLRDAIRTLEVRTRRNRRWLGAGLGLLGGGAVGLGVAYIGGSSCEPQFDFDCLGWVLAIPVGALVGTVTGVIIGGGEKWQHWQSRYTALPRMKRWASARAREMGCGAP